MIRILILLIIILSCAASLPAAVANAVADRFAPLPSGAVQLTGLVEERIQHSIAHWNKGVVPYRGLVQRFRQGRDFFAQGEMWGKAVRSACQFYRYTRDAELQRLLAATVADLLTTRRENGSISCTAVAKQPDSKGGDLWERKYVLLGLEGYYELVEADGAVLQAMIDEVDATIAQIGPPPKVRITDQGWSRTGIESSSILEPVMRLYRLTGERRFLDFARYIVEAGGARGSDLFAEALVGKDPEQMGRPYPKAYEMLSVFEGAVEYYRATGEERWRQAALRFFDGVRTQEITLVGNGGGDQPYHPEVSGEAWDYTAREQANPAIRRMMETCTGVTWLKFCYQLLCLTGDAMAAEEMERYIYNGLLGAMKPEGDGFSYVNLLNGLKTDSRGWGGKVDGVYCTCCNLNGPMGLAYIPLMSVMTSPQGPVINLYAAQTVHARTPSGRALTLVVGGDYPRDGQLSIAVEPEAAERFAIALRIPSWSAETRLEVDGQAVAATPGTYAVLDRNWSPGDRISLALDLRPRLIPAPHGSNRAADHVQAVVRGPLVLARDENLEAGFDQPVALTQQGLAAATLVPAQAPLYLRLSVPVAGGSITLVDYASVDSWSGKRICTWLPMAGFASPRWIWFPAASGSPDRQAPVGTRWFRRELELPPGRRVERACMRMSADNRFQLLVNGRRLGGGDDWEQVAVIDIGAALHPGGNLLAVEAENLPYAGANNAAGLIGVLDVVLDDGSRQLVATDGSWWVTDRPQEGWQEPGHPLEGWRRPVVMGANGSAPWHYLALDGE